MSAQIIRFPAPTREVRFNPDEPMHKLADYLARRVQSEGKECTFEEMLASVHAAFALERKQRKERS